ncbi:MAG: hypothetical protein P4L53_09060 [Candidatus Obscuribacterales bacterium]|nr:hypothetical protein [Candidatus Obscuribacterales bacterium]
MCKNENCAAKAGSERAFPAIGLNRAPLNIVNTTGPNSVRLSGKGHAIYVVDDGFVTAMSGAVVIMKKGRIIANAGSTVVAYPGVTVVKAHKKAVILSPSAA